MIGIFLRWRQLGRRYFWPHLLLGMVAASLGLPACAQNAEPNLAAGSPASSLFIGSAARLDHLAQLHESVRRPGFTIDYWHQHAIRTVIRHLSFTLAPQPEAQGELPLAVHKLALIDSLHALLTITSAQPLLPSDNKAAPCSETVSPAHTLWRAKVHGIRAGPVILLA